MKSKIKDLIKDNRLSEAIQLINSTNTNKALRKTITLLESRINSFKEKKNLGVISNENENLELNNIRLALIEISEQIDKKETIQTSRNKNNQALYGLIIIMILILLKCFNTYLDNPEPESSKPESIDSIFQEENTPKENTTPVLKKEQKTVQLILEGMISNENGDLLENVKVVGPSNQETTSNSMGFYTFNFSDGKLNADEKIKFYYSKEGYETISVRFLPFKKNADVILTKKQ